MPAYDWSNDYNAFTKQCSSCKHVFIGGQTNEETRVILLQFFPSSNGKAQMADGFQSRCRDCNQHRRRQLGANRPVLEDMFIKQEGHCAICEKDISILVNAPADIHAHVDHDDTTGKVRALLCGGCNRGIGIFRHDPKLLRSAADYLDKHKSNVVILDQTNGRQTG